VLPGKPPQYKEPPLFKVLTTNPQNPYRGPCHRPPVGGRRPLTGDPEMDPRWEGTNQSTRNHASKELPECGTSPWLQVGGHQPKYKEPCKQGVTRVRYKPPAPGGRAPTVEASCSLSSHKTSTEGPSHRPPVGGRQTLTGDPETTNHSTRNHASRVLPGGPPQYEVPPLFKVLTTNPQKPYRGTLPPAPGGRAPTTNRGP
jgi:hypothetical protein